ncbi:MAG TPA: type IV pilus assembly protein PilM [Phycisphaerae bacterium]|nr:type IV pilus assembly protein PilM [Phycisphaerae bacterium]
MASKQPVWGIDVGQCLLKAIKLQHAGDGVEMLAFDVVEHESILSEGETDAAGMIAKALQTFASRNNLKDSRIVVSVPGQQTLTRFTKMPPVEAKKIPDMVQYEASQQIPFDLDEVVWDYQVFAEKDSPDVEVGIFAIRKELIRNYLIHFTDQGIEPFIVQTSPMASYNAARFEQGTEPQKACVLLDMGALATDLIVMEGNRIWSRPIPIGGNRFTEALVSAFKISFKKAEKLKRNAATSKYARQVFQAMRPVFADLVSEVQRSVGYYTSTHREAQITRVIGMGNAFKLPGLQKFLNQNLQIEVERLSGFKKMAAANLEQSSPFVDNIASFAVAYGLAIQGLGLAGVQSNLIPLEVRKTLLWRKKRPWFTGAAACLAVAGASLWVGNVLAEGQINSAKGNLSSISVQRVSSKDEAERIVNGSAGEAPLEKGAKVAGAAEWFQSELNKVNAGLKGDQSFLKALAKLPENNVFVPRIMDVIHRAAAAAAPADLKTAATAGEYRKVAEQVARPERRYLWIEKLDMLYHPQDPSIFFLQAGQKPTGPRKAGWAVQITGGTSDPKPAKWLDETLIKTLDTLGKAPGKGFYVEKVSLAKVMKRPAESATVVEPEKPLAGGGGNTPGSGGGRGGRGRGRGTDGGGTGGRGGRGGGPGLPNFGGGGPTEPVESAGGGSVAEETSKVRDKAKDADPVTGEKMTEDQRFVIEVIIRKGDTPANLIPEEFKPKKPDEKKPAAKQS